MMVFKIVRTKLKIKYRTTVDINIKTNKLKT